MNHSTQASGSSNLLAIGSPGPSLRVETGGPYSPGAADPEMRTWQRAVIHVEAHPFAGSFETILTPEDVAGYRQALDQLAMTGRAKLGGDRAAEIRLEIDGQVIEVTITPSGDDPWPLLRYLILPTDSQTDAPRP